MCTILRYEAVSTVISMEFFPLCYNYVTLNYKFLSDTTVFFVFIYLLVYATYFGHILTINA